MCELYINVVGGDNPDERMVCAGSLSECIEAMQANDGEVATNMDKYFELSTPERNYTFSSYDEYCQYSYMVAV